MVKIHQIVRIIEIIFFWDQTKSFVGISEGSEYRGSDKWGSTIYKPAYLIPIQFKLSHKLEFLKLNFYFQITKLKQFLSYSQNFFIMMTFCKKFVGPKQHEL
eukprot:TRINITY_DN2398_c1_g1_i2.p5 TRINITY_DN2398_c1_g1~~TRINITY_DN2398_c1_g1_i2.p5  ORF type:complete len:102 (-),score=1.29 TRINITY_DN2398_c1_g1_i2:477-782(-)